MAVFKSDLQDIYFNLFNVLDVAKHSEEMEDNDLKEIVNEYNKFCDNELFSTRITSDGQGCRLKDGQVLAPESLHQAHKQFHENGWFALGLPEEFGGMVAPHALVSACQSLAIGSNTAWYMYPGLTNAALNVILAKGTQEEKELYSAKMIEGSWGGTMCLTEAGAGSDVGALRTTAAPNGDGTYKVNGVKTFISSGDSDLYENIIHLVLARTPDAPKGTKGLSLFLVPKYKINADGSNGEANDVVCTKIEEKMGIHANATCELTFGNDGGCVGTMIGDEFQGIATMFIMMNEARLHCGAQGEAQANLTLMLTEQYIKERVQFGTEIVHLLDVKRNFLKMRAQSRGMRALCLYTADLFDREKKDKGLGGLIALLTPVCKAHCSDQGFQVSVDAIQAHGGYGFCTEYGIEQFARDTKIASIYEGTNGIQAMDFVTRKILKDQGVSLKKLTDLIMGSMEKGQAIFPKEMGLFGKVLGSAKQVTDKIGAAAMKKDFNTVLQHCTDFLNFSGNLVVAWRLLDNAIEAKKALEGNVSEEEKVYLESKLVDFQIFTGHYLIHNLSIAKTIVDYEQNLASISL